MDEQNKLIPESETAAEVQEPVSEPDNGAIMESLAQAREEIAYLRDLFVRRLNDDKQKNAAIQKLAEGATFAYIEPFLYDIILLLDRLEKSEDDFVASVSEELYGIIHRRGVNRIEVTREFNPALFKAVKMSESPEAEALYVSGTIRNGYVLSGKVIRPAEVAVVRPTPKPAEAAKPE